MCVAHNYISNGDVQPSSPRISNKSVSSVVKSTRYIRLSMFVGSSIAQMFYMYPVPSIDHEKLKHMWRVWIGHSPAHSPKDEERWIIGRVVGEFDVMHRIYTRCLKFNAHVYDQNIQACALFLHVN